MIRISVGYVFLLIIFGSVSQAQNINEFQSVDVIALEINLDEMDATEVEFNEYRTGWWTRRYLLDYTIVAAGITGYAIGKDLEPRSNSMFGPSYDSDNLIELFEYGELNKTFLEPGVEESVPEYYIHRAIGINGAFLLGMEWREQRSGRGSPQRIHQTFVGYAEAVALNAAITELLKPVFARLRPDFRERALRFHCPDLTSSEFDLYCSDFRNRPLDEDPDEAQDLLDDGRKSFFSGHSSNSFALFGYTSLAIGGRYVWGEDATTRSRVLGITAQAAAISYATYISSSRVRDGKHFVSDTVVGAAVGTAIANLSYWRRFHRSGEIRGSSTRDDRSELTVIPWAGSGSGGLSLNLNF